MSAENKFITNKPSVLSNLDIMKTIQIGVVCSVDDPQSLGRIKVKIPGQQTQGGDDGIAISDLPWCYPLIPKFFTSVPKVGEGVFIMVQTKMKTSSDRLYFGPIISQLSNLELDPVATTALSPFTFGIISPKTDPNTIPALKGVFPLIDDIAIQGRYNTDFIFRENHILIRAGKFIESPINANNPYPFQFNITTPAYIQIKNNININQPVNGSVMNMVANKINLLTHLDGNPRYNLANQDDQLSDDEILNILETAHPLPFGDLLVQYLKLLKNAFLNHVHSSNGTPPTDLSIGTKNVKNFMTNSTDLENRMLSRNIRIN